jgi:hypothetical protein
MAADEFAAWLARTNAGEGMLLGGNPMAGLSPDVPA